MSTEREPTTQEPPRRIPRTPPARAIAEVLCHPDLDRIGDWIEVGSQPITLQRTEPVFQGGRPLAHGFIPRGLGALAWHGGWFHWQAVPSGLALAAPGWDEVPPGKPLRPGSLLVLGSSLILGLDHRPVRTRDPRLHDFAGESAAIWEAWDQVALYARSPLPVLIQASSGAGKERIAEALHRQSGRRGPLVRLNAATLTPELAASHLFGHVRGAFTGATADHRGCFEQADGGTLFIDEIAELPAAVQPQLLRVLQEGRLRRLGDAGPERAVDVRVVTATHADLPACVARGAFRQDLLSRLDTLPLSLPDLADRPLDIPHLVRAFLARPGQREHPWFDAEGMLGLLRADWSTNQIRQLRAVVEVARLEGEGQGLPSVPLTLPAGVRPAARARPTPADAHAALARCNGNISQAARLLGISRRTLRRLLDETAAE
ncbi:MAG: sigma 54-interacting transcriptional regulator [bacterium]